MADFVVVTLVALVTWVFLLTHIKRAYNQLEKPAPLIKRQLLVLVVAWTFLPHTP